jgi:hypothetical protein
MTGGFEVADDRFVLLSEEYLTSRQRPRLSPSSVGCGVDRRLKAIRAADYAGRVLEPPPRRGPMYTAPGYEYR